MTVAKAVLGLALVLGSIPPNSRMAESIEMAQNSVLAVHSEYLP